MKAHEEKWATDGYGLVASDNGSGPRVATIHAQTLEVERTRTLLVSAAPDMARALLRLLSVGNYSALSDAEDDARAALKKAGVLE